jgi:hypothetical protein
MSEAALYEAQEAQREEEQLEQEHDKAEAAKAWPSWMQAGSSKDVVGDKDATDKALVAAERTRETNTTIAEKVGARQAETFGKGSVLLWMWAIVVLGVGEMAARPHVADVCLPLT